MESRSGFPNICLFAGRYLCGITLYERSLSLVRRRLSLEACSCWIKALCCRNDGSNSGGVLSLSLRHVLIFVILLSLSFLWLWITNHLGFVLLWFYFIFLSSQIINHLKSRRFPESWISYSYCQVLNFPNSLLGWIRPGVSVSPSPTNIYFFTAFRG